MTSTETKQQTSTSGDGRATAVSAANSPLTTSRGTTTIADSVVSTIAGIAAHEVNGVYQLGGGAARMVGSLRERIPGASVNYSQGVSVEVGEKQAAVDVDIVAEYGVSIVDLANGIRRNVIDTIERMTGLQVTEVDISVHDVHVDDGSDESRDESKSSRTQSSNAQ